MDKIKRTRFQGVINIIEFNWHMYAIGLLAISVFLMAFLGLEHGKLSILFLVLLVISLIAIILPLIISHYIYDRSGLYHFSWLEEIFDEYYSSRSPSNLQINSLSAGFDETSAILVNKYKFKSFQAYDFYNPVKHTEVSIRRANKKYPSFPGTIKVETDNPTIKLKKAELILAILSLHEIRTESERVQFFKSLKQSLHDEGKIVVVEHLQDLANFVGFNFGFLHFHTRSTWLKTIAKADLELKKEVKITPFISAFILS